MPTPIRSLKIALVATPLLLALMTPRADAASEPHVERAYALNARTIAVVMTVSIDRDAFTRRVRLKDLHEQQPKSIQTVGSASPNATLFSLEMKAPLDPSHAYVLEYGDAPGVLVDASTLFSNPTFDEQHGYGGVDLGAVRSHDRTQFKVWAPTALNMQLNLYRSGHKVERPRTTPMRKESSGVWSVTVDDDLQGMYYTYVVEAGEGSFEVVDPYAKGVGLNGRRGMVIDLAQADPRGWAKDRGPRLKKPNDAVVYELHVRDMSISESSGIRNKGRFLGLVEPGTSTLEGTRTGLDHLKELGVTHVQILPMFDFGGVDESELHGGRYNWGYNPENYNVPEGWYSTNPRDGAVRVAELKQTIQRLHSEGIGVIMDVVYNHTGPNRDSNLNRLVPNYYHRSRDGRFTNGSLCGNETASQRAMVRKLIVDSVLQWVNEYHVDGFRFDLMGLHDIKTMQAVRQACDRVDPGIIIYGEAWHMMESGLPVEQRLVLDQMRQAPGIGAFGPELRDGIQGAPFIYDDTGFVSGKTGAEDDVKFGVAAAVRHPDVDYAKVGQGASPWAEKPSQAVNYVTCHDGLTLWDRLSRSVGTATRAERIRMQQLASGIILTSQGIPFLHAGVDMLRSKQGEHNSYKSPDTINQIDWDEKTRNMTVFRYHQGLIEMRKAHPAFRLGTAEEIRTHLTFFSVNGKPPLSLPSQNMVGFLLNDHAGGDPAGALITFYNANPSEQLVTLPDGEWDAIANDQAAGNQVLNTVSNRVVVPGRSLLVLTRGTPMLLP